MATRTRYLACPLGHQPPGARQAGYQPLPGRTARQAGTCEHCEDTGLVAVEHTVPDRQIRDYWGATATAPVRDEHDITAPPGGCQPVRCTAGCDDGMVDLPRAITGPIMGTPLSAGELSTVLRAARCRACRGRGWVWGYDGPPGTNS